MSNEQKLNNIQWGKIIGYFLIFFGVVGFLAGDFFSGFMFLILGLALLPIVIGFVQSKWNIQVTKTKKIVFFVIGFLILGISMGSSDTTEEKATTGENSDQQTSPIAQVVQESVALSQEQPVEVQKTLYPVLAVVDGDTVSVEIDGKKEVLRLIGINTPETVDPRTPVQCFGKEASAKAKEILIGKKVFVEGDSTQSERDKYNRLLRYIFLEDGTNFNKLMIEEGYAYEYTYNAPYKYQEEFKNAEKAAREAQKGLWAEDTCNGELQTPKSSASTDNSSLETGATTAKTETNSSSGQSCAGKHLCGQMTSCKEAYFYLNSCGVSSLDRDKDGVPCETICN